jgi:hypothetical protein
MKRRNHLVFAAMLGIAAQANAATAAVPASLAACSKALVESISSAEPLPLYTVKLKSGFVTEMTERNSYTVLAHSKKSKTLIAKASCKATPDGEIVEFKPLPTKS